MIDDIRRRTVLGASMTAIVTAPLADRTLQAFGSDTQGLTIHLIGAPATSRVEVRGLDGRIRRFSTRPEALSRVAIVSVPSRRFAVRMDSGRWRWLVRGDANQVWIMCDGDHEDPATYRSALPVPTGWRRPPVGLCRGGQFHSTDCLVFRQTCCRCDAVATSRLSTLAAIFMPATSRRSFSTTSPTS